VDHVGPFISSGGNVYVILLDSADTSIIEAWKATDPETSFSEQNSAGKPDLTNLVTAMSVYQVGDVLHIATQEDVTSRVAYHTFNMATDLWAIVNETVDAMGGTAVLVTTVSIILRSDGDVIILYAGALDTVTMTAYNRVDYARREAAVWTTGIAVDNAGADDWLPGTAVLGSSDRSHFFFQNDDVDDGYQRTLTSANALEAFPAAFDVSVEASAGNIDIGSGISYISGGNTKVRVPYLDTSLISIVQFNSADAPTVTLQSGVTSYSPGFGTVNRSILCCTADGTTLWLLAQDTVTTDLHRDSNADDAGFGTDVVEFVGTVRKISGNVYTRSSFIRLAYLMADSGVVKYNEVQLTFPAAVTKQLAALGVG
jgi:hypothetical protein